MPIKNQVCLFFYINEQFYLHGCDLDDAEHYGDFLIYSDSHFNIWNKHYDQKYDVDFDYFPRGRVAYHQPTQTFQILYDRCIGDAIHTFTTTYYDDNFTLDHDEHYQCHTCNKGYII